MRDGLLAANYIATTLSLQVIAPSIGTLKPRLDKNLVNACKTSVFYTVASQGCTNMDADQLPVVFKILRRVSGRAGRRRARLASVRSSHFQPAAQGQIEFETRGDGGIPDGRAHLIIDIR